jgi:hypothetical protein
MAVGRFIDLAKEPPFGRLTALRLAGRAAGGQAVWLCRCACPAGTLVRVLANNLRRGHTRSCGCLRRERAGRQIGLGARCHGHHWPRTCAGCGVAFLGTPKQRYHSRACRQRHEYLRRKAKAAAPPGGPPTAPRLPS